jgi:hypothetical protein
VPSEPSQNSHARLESLRSRAASVSLPLRAARSAIVLNKTLIGQNARARNASAHLLGGPATRAAEEEEEEEEVAVTALRSNANTCIAGSRSASVGRRVATRGCAVAAHSELRRHASVACVIGTATSAANSADAASRFERTMPCPTLLHAAPATTAPTEAATVSIIVDRAGVDRASGSVVAARGSSRGSSVTTVAATLRDCSNGFIIVDERVHSCSICDHSDGAAGAATTPRCGGDSLIRSSITIYEKENHP